MEDYPRTALMGMLTATVTGPDLAEVLGPVTGRGPVIDALIDGLGPVVVRLLQVGIGLGGRAAAGTVSLGEVEQELRTSGRELIRAAMQAVMDAASAAEERRPGGVDGPDGVRRRRVEDGHARSVATVFGRIRVCRLAYRAPLAANVHPLDEVLDLPAGLYSPGLARLCAQESVRGSFTDAADAVEYATGVRIGTRQIIELTRAAAADATAFYADPGREVSAAAPDDALVITADGKGVPVRPEALRPGTAKLATKAKTSATDDSSGSKPHRKRMAELVCVYDLTPVPRTVEDILPTLIGDGDGDGEGEGEGEGEKPAAVKAPTATGKWLTASLIEDIPTVIAAGFDEATRRDPTHTRDWVALVDGNTTQIEAITAQAAARGVDVTILVDYLHVAGYVWDAAKALFCTDTTAGMTLARTWVHERSRMILHGRALEVADRIRTRVRDSKLTTAQRKSALEAATYLTNKAPHLDYPTALARGWPIATGVIEGACRHLVQDRMDITGARWGLDTAQAVLTLRAIATTGDLAQYWRYHQQQEHHRTYSASTTPTTPALAA
ncbi:MAG TPA: ISKra4 family transposase [Umezawaea sp.]|nr:ISKra4 family transposase [Umezawaea sp.]